VYSEGWLLPKGWEGGSRAWCPASRQVLPARAHPHSAQAGWTGQDRSWDSSQPQPRVPIIRQIHSHEAGLRSSQEISLQVRVSLSTARGQAGQGCGWAGEQQSSIIAQAGTAGPGLSRNQDPRPAGRAIGRGPWWGWSVPWQVKPMVLHQ